ncbi:hypothetical protein J6590_102316, partial [Homalodisca vitripennis]
MPRENKKGKRVMKRKIRKKNQSKRRMKRNPRGDRRSRPKNVPADPFNIGASNGFTLGHVTNTADSNLTNKVVESMTGHRVL